MANLIHSILRRMKSNTADETNGRHIVAPMVIELCRALPSAAVLDVGAGYGADLLAVRSALPGTRLAAIETYPSAVSHLRSNGVDVGTADLEREPLPFASNSFDVVVCNQVAEHLKEHFWLVSELARVCKVDGHIVLGTPNLGSWHNRVLLLAGKQPPAIHVFGPHVRGFTNAGMVDFLEEGQVLRVERTIGGNFYPFQPRFSRPLARMFPGLAVSSFFSVRKVRDASFLDVFASPRGSELADTTYFRGTAAPTS